MQSFEDYRDRMLAIMSDARSQITASCPASSEKLDLARIRMARTITAYHLYADRELFTPSLSSTDPARRALVKEIAAECAALANDFRAFTRACTERPVLNRWAEYQSQSQTMMERIHKHLRSAEIEIRRPAELRTANAPPGTRHAA